MATGVTMYHFTIALSDVDRGVYESLDLRLARHPSESLRYLVTRLLAYCLSYEEGIRFSKEGLSASDEPPVLVRNPEGVLLAWIDVGNPGAARLHKAAKGRVRVSIFTHHDLRELTKLAAAGAVHRANTIEIWPFTTDFLDALEQKLDRNTTFELARSDDRLYLTFPDATLEGVVTRSLLAESDPAQ